MILRSSLILACLVFPAANAFTASFSNGRNLPSRLILGITADEILANARKKAGVPEEEKIEIFDDDTRGDMASALLKLEKRIQEGAGGLSSLEVEELAGELKRIIAEMKLNPHKTVENLRPRDEEKLEEPASPVPQAAATENAKPRVTESSTWYDEGMGHPGGSTNTFVVAGAEEMTPAEYQKTLQERASKRYQDEKKEGPANPEEGPGYDGGMGQPRGTTNTYIIDGMDEMSAAEYQKALQESVSQHQNHRKASTTTGNRASWDYLNHLTGESGILKDDK